MSFWSENYSFIKDVYDTRVTKMTEWMDHIERAIGKVMATKVYTSAEFKRERDNFLSLCKNLERAETKKWLSEVMEVLFRDRNNEEKKDENKRFEALIERHLALVPKVNETQVKSEVFWKCYEYGDDLVQIFEFIDDQRTKSVREIVIQDPEATEEIVDKHASIVRIMENKRRTVEEFIAKGEKLMEDPKSPKFLENHVNKLKEAWDSANKCAMERKNALNENLEAWRVYEEKRVDCGKNLDMADAELKGIKKNYNMERGPLELTDKLKIAATLRFEIEELFNQTEASFKTLCIFAPEEKKKEMEGQVEALRVRLVVLNNIDESLADLYKFNNELIAFDKTITELDTWIAGKAQEKLGIIRKPEDETAPSDPEERVTRTMELMEDLLKRTTVCAKAEDKRTELFPSKGEKISKDAREFLDRLKSTRENLTKLDDEVQTECIKFSGDVKFFAEYQTRIRHFYPWLCQAESSLESGIIPPSSLLEACNKLGECKTYLDECDKAHELLEEAGVSAKKMTFHKNADVTLQGYRIRLDIVRRVAQEWVRRMKELVECWDRLEGRVGELSSWVQAADSKEPDGKDELSIEKLEGQLDALKQSFREKEDKVGEILAACTGKSMYPTEEELQASAEEGVEEDKAEESTETNPAEDPTAPAPAAEPTAPATAAAPAAPAPAAAPKAPAPAATPAPAGQDTAESQANA